MKHVKRLIIVLLVLSQFIWVEVFLAQKNIINQITTKLAGWEKTQNSLINDLKAIQTSIKSVDQVLREHKITPTYQTIMQQEGGADTQTKLNFDFEMFQGLKPDEFFKTTHLVQEHLALWAMTQQQDVAKLIQSLKAVKNAVALNLPNMWPATGTVTSLFGIRNHPILKKQKMHGGVDIANLKTTDIVSTADGEVLVAGKFGNFGKTVIVDHHNGFKTLYGHADSLFVSQGTSVKRGTLIARMGSTGLSTGDHVHYEVFFADEPVDPTMFVE